MLGRNCWQLKPIAERILVSANVHITLKIDVPEVLIWVVMIRDAFGNECRLVPERLRMSDDEFFVPSLENEIDIVRRS